MTGLEWVQQNLALLLPLIILEFALIVAALFDLARRSPPPTGGTVLQPRWRCALAVPAGSVLAFAGLAGPVKRRRFVCLPAQRPIRTAWIRGVETTRTISAARTTNWYLPQDPAFYSWMTPLEYPGLRGAYFDLDGKTRSPY
ncbi:MAG: hypothetical protein H6661_08505 [Ardenticatenaceae bacterium]|nr:hypothetical protein [Ardenticatenaceae bacterium]